MTLVQYTAFVDSVFGVAHPQLQNSSAPFLSIMMAITAILNSANPPSQFQEWDIRVSPGTYFESPTLPGFVNLLGSGTSTSLVGTLTVTGAGIVQSLLIDTNNAPSVIVNRPINIGDAAFDDVVIVNSWSGNYSTGTAINVIIGDCTFESGALLSSFSGNANSVSAVYSTGGLALFNVLTSFSTSGTIKQAYVFQFEGDKSTITECTINADFTGGNKGAIFRGTNITAAMKENRITVDASGISEVALTSAGAGAILLLTSNYIDTSGVAPTNSFLSVADANIATSMLPQVRILADEFVQTEIPKSKGTFGQLSYDLFDQDGTFAFTGGFYAPIKSVCGDYTLGDSDHTLLVNCQQSTIHVARGNAGQMIFIKNVSSKSARIQGQLFDNDTTLNAGESFQMQSDGTQWYLLSQF